MPPELLLRADFCFLFCVFRFSPSVRYASAPFAGLEEVGSGEVEIEGDALAGTGRGVVGIRPTDHDLAAGQTTMDVDPVAQRLGLVHLDFEAVAMRTLTPGPPKMLRANAVGDGP